VLAPRYGHVAEDVDALLDPRIAGDAVAPAVEPVVLVPARTRRGQRGIDQHDDRAIEVGARLIALQGLAAARLASDRTVWSSSSSPSREVVPTSIESLSAHLECAYLVYVSPTAAQIGAFLVRLRRAVDGGRVEIRGYAG
jgi:hypothetical protein